MDDTEQPTGSFGEVLHALAAAPSVAPRPPIEPGTLIGERFEVVRWLGAGGMGAVYLARDRSLQREVAIKLHTGIGRDAGAMLEREAQAMARVRHANVVTVYEVSEDAGRLFVAMEYLGGGTLADWLDAEPRGWRAITERFVAAGRGLSAAHSAGVVHRDFKPSNVMCEGARTCVTDFGLAHQISGEDLTAGAGTPRFMAPEVRDGTPGDARADQFSFAIALRDALGRRRVPGALRRTLDRATAHDPAQRWPSMSALLTRLERVLARRRIAIGGGLLGVAVSSALLAGRISAPAGPGPTCVAAPAAAVWTPARRDAVIATLGGATAAERTVATLDRAARALDEQARAACAAPPGDPLRAVRLACLAERQAQLDAVIDVLVTPPLPPAWRAVEVAEGLASAADCGRVATISQLPPPPATTAGLAELAAIQRDQARASALFDVGATAQARELRVAILTRARALGYAPALATALFQLAMTEPEPKTAQRYYDEAVAVAMAAHDDDTAALVLSHAATDLARRGDSAEAERWITMARATAARDPDDAALAADVEINAANVYGYLADDERGGDVDRAREVATRAIELARRAHPDRPLVIARGLNALGGIEHVAGHLDAVEAHYREALALAAAVHPDHELVALMHRNLAHLALERGDLATAETEVRAALAVDERTGAHDSYAESAERLTYVLNAGGRFDEAVTVARAGLARIDERAADPLHVAGLHTNLAIALSMRGDHGPAADAFQHALAAFERGLAADHPQLIAARANLGTTMRMAGRLPEALAAHRAAFDAATRLLAPAHPRRLNVTVELALTLLAGGDAAEAHRLLTAAVAQLTEQGRAGALAEARFALARSTLATGGSRARAVALARQAESFYATDPAGAAMRDEIRAWLRAPR